MVGKTWQEKKQRLLALAKQKREEVAATAKSRLKICDFAASYLSKSVCFCVTRDRNNIIVSGSSRTFFSEVHSFLVVPKV